MNRKLILASSLAVTLGLAGCQGLKEALTAHVDVVARAGTQELSVTHLGDLIGNARVPLRKDVATTVAQIWVSYQLLGYAGAHGDTLADPKVADEAMWSVIAQEKSKAFYDKVAKEWTKVDSASLPAKYAAGDMYAARHILLMAPRNGMSDKQRDSVKAELEKIRKTVTAANFADVAKVKSMDGSKSNGGSLGVFPPGAMVPEFEAAVKALKPGEVSGVFESQFGFHIVKRLEYAEVAKEFAQSYGQIAAQKAESTFMAGLEKGAKLEVKPGAPKAIRAIVEDLDAHRDDKTVLATWKGGSLTSARIVQWISAMPPQARIKEQIAQAPDSALPSFVQNVARNELIIRAADSVKAVPDTQVVANVRGQFRQAVIVAMEQLKVSPAALKDSAKTEAERERLAAARVDAYFEQLLQEKAQFIQIQEPVAAALKAKFESRIVTAGVERALERAIKVRQVADSTRASQQPASAVPMPGAPSVQPQAAAPAAKPAGDSAKKPTEPVKKP